VSGIRTLLASEQGGQFPKKLWYCVGGEVKHRILDLSTDEGLTLETSAFNLFTVANSPYELSWQIKHFAFLPVVWLRTRNSPGTESWYISWSKLIKLLQFPKSPFNTFLPKNPCEAKLAFGWCHPSWHGRIHQHNLRKVAVSYTSWFTLSSVEFTLFCFFQRRKDMRLL